MEFFAKTFDELTTKEFIQILKSRSQIFTIEQNKKRCFIYTSPQYHKSVFWNLPIQGRDL